MLPSTMPAWVRDWKCCECGERSWSWKVDDERQTGIVQAKGVCLHCKVKVSLRFDRNDNYRALLTDVKVPSRSKLEKSPRYDTVHRFLSDFVEGF